MTSSPTIATRPATDYSLAELAAIITASFEAYFYPGVVSAEQLSRRVRTEQIDLASSLVLLDGDAPAGVALLARRAARAWCAGFGIYAAARGRGLAHTLAAAMVAQARGAGVRELSLEVLTRNAPAIRAYQRAGMQIVRDLLILQWQRPEGWEVAAPPEIRDADPAELLAHFTRLHPTPAAWQRDLPALLAGDGLRGIAAGAAGAPAGYLLFQGQDGGRIRLVDLATQEAPAAEALLLALQARAESIVTINEPAESPLTDALLARGFSEIDRQHELRIALDPPSAEAPPEH